jgi:class 3 adenylate cyclase
MAILNVEEKISVFFDLCSSSSIVEDLVVQGKLKLFAAHINSLKKFLDVESGDLEFEVYKFIGDGWILLFPPTFEGDVLIDFLNRLSHYFRKSFRELIKNELDEKPQIIGLTFGVAYGRLIRMVMLGRREYIGRSLNVASRLQGAIKDRDHNPQYKVLMTRAAAKKLDIKLNPPHIKIVRRKLRNILGGKEARYVKIVLPLIRS